jgi:endonuclease III
VKHSPIYAKRLASLLRRLKQSAAPIEPRQRPPLMQLIHAFLHYDATARQADAALHRLEDGLIDLNDLRVSDPYDLALIVGEDYPNVLVRCARLKQSLNAIYHREHAMALDAILKKSKTDARNYLESLDGMIPFVSASVMLFCMDGHAIPVDQQLRDRLVDDGVVDQHATIQEIQAFIENHISHSQAAQVHSLLRAYVEKNVKVNLGPLNIPVPKAPPAPPLVVVKPPPMPPFKPPLQPSPKRGTSSRPAAKASPRPPKNKKSPAKSHGKTKRR